MRNLDALSRFKQMLGYAFVFGLMAGNLFAQSTDVGPYCGQHIVSEPGEGHVWEAVAEAKCDDNDAKAYSYPLRKGEFTQTLLVQDFGFEIPSQADIEGIEVVVIRRSDLNGGMTDKQAQIVIGNQQVGENLKTQETWSNEWVAVYYGGNAEKWGLSLTPKDINSANFGFAFQAMNLGQTTRPEVDEVLVTIHYSLPGNIWFMTKSRAKVAENHCTTL